MPVEVRTTAAPGVVFFRRVKKVINAGGERIGDYGRNAESVRACNCHGKGAPGQDEPDANGDRVPDGYGLRRGDGFETPGALATASRHQGLPVTPRSAEAPAAGFPSEVSPHLRQAQRTSDEVI
ncbi:MAG TPA: hypothetical protein PKY77_26765, partial [Phycisphaerae bacterium]|nr:hypothetical protein [Phycisphaerae bacterium]HRY70618.1 hypothetical protein [Phycisphaerae bacterium]HSA30160.1 hypothetical protein [Phycisphaerae bacterium]